MKDTGVCIAEVGDCIELIGVRIGEPQEQNFVGDDIEEPDIVVGVPDTEIERELGTAVEEPGTGALAGIVVEGRHGVQGPGTEAEAGIVVEGRPWLLGQPRVG
jgi:hypothetical protein